MAHGRDRKLLEAGTRAPDFALKHLDGEPTTLGEIVARGPALLAFFKVNCQEDTRAFNRHFGLTLPTLLDAESSGFPASNAFGISSVPTLFVVEPDGTISEVSEGWRKHDIAQFGARAGVNTFRPADSVPEAKSG